MGTRWQLSRWGCILGWDPAPQTLTTAVVLQGRGRHQTVHEAGERWQLKEQGPKRRLAQKPQGCHEQTDEEVKGVDFGRRAGR